MDAIGSGGGIKKHAEVDAWLAVRRESHHLPLVRVWSETEKAGEVSVEKAE